MQLRIPPGGAEIDEVQEGEQRQSGAGKSRPMTAGRESVR